MTGALAGALAVETLKLRRATTVRVATVASVLLIPATSVGGFAAYQSGGISQLAQRMRTLVTGANWDGFCGLAGLSMGVTLLLAAGIVTSWHVGREFTDGTIVGLFALPIPRRVIAAAKLFALLGWGVLVALIATVVTVLGGVALGLPAADAAGSATRLLAVAVLVITSALPLAWIATIGRGYLAGIGATLGLVIATNLAAGFGAGTYIPWASPILWANPTTHTPPALLTLTLLVGAVGATLTLTSWHTLQLGDRR